MNEKIKLLTDNRKEVLSFLKGRYHLYHLSNVFFRDLHYGVMAYFEMKSVRYTYVDAELTTRMWIETLEQTNILKRVDGGAWMLNYPEFKKPAVKPTVAAKPVAPAAKLATPAVAKPAIAPATPVGAPAPAAAVEAPKS
ncbi:MAG: hypothetical protein HY276_06385 [Ignavibacteriales bacterium]|nr:hypothetical protein [Ignavibacteriales bacterium]